MYMPWILNWKPTPNYSDVECGNIHSSLHYLIDLSDIVYSSWLSLTLIYCRLCAVCSVELRMSSLRLLLMIKKEVQISNTIHEYMISFLFYLCVCCVCVFSFYFSAWCVGAVCSKTCENFCLKKAQKLPRSNSEW